jgi:hypothetical protein
MINVEVLQTALDVVTDVKLLFRLNNEFLR